MSALADPTLHMDPTAYDSLKTPRGYTYGYYHQVPSKKSLPHILFLHGFPSTSQDWSSQVAHFTKLGYGVVVPDLLGYGKTDKPTDYKEYKSADMAGDVVAILDKEGLDKVIVVAHDWGCSVASRLADLHPRRLLAAAFLAVGYWPAPSKHIPLEDMLQQFQQAYGTDVLGYWTLFTADEGYKIMDANANSLYDIMFPAKPEIWGMHLAPKDAAKNFVTSNERLNALPSFWTDQARRLHQDNIMLHGGFQAPTNWYKVHAAGLNANPDQDPKHKLDFRLPVFFGAALQDYVCLKAMGETNTRKVVDEKQLTIRDFDTGHWIMQQASDELNQELGAFFEGVVSK